MGWETVMKSIHRYTHAAVATAALMGSIALVGSSAALAQIRGAPPPPVGAIGLPSTGPISPGVDHFRSPNSGRKTRPVKKPRGAATKAKPKRKKAVRPNPRRKKVVRRNPPVPPQFAPSSPPPLPPRAPLADRRPNEVLVLLRDGQTDAVADDIAQRYGLVRRDSLSIELLGGEVHRFEVSPGRLQDVVSELRNDAEVIAAQQNFLYHPLGSEKKKREAQSRQYALTKLGIEPAHKLAKGRDVSVAVIDTGIDKSHPALSASIAKSFDAVKDGKPTAHAHGTAIAGVISAQGQIQGVAPMARLYAVRAFYAHPRRKRPETSSFILLRALKWVSDEGVRVVNMSFAGPADPLVKSALGAVHAKGMVLIAAAGNGGPDAPPAFPAAYDSVIAITALDHKDRLYKQANQGTYVNVAAPGVDVLVTALSKRYGYASGTSLAAAHVSGQVALMMEHDPDASASYIRETIIETAHDLGPVGHDTLFGAGRADAHASLVAMSNIE